MKHFLLYIAVGGILLTAFDSTLTQMTMADCNAGIEAACRELDKWLFQCLLPKTKLSTLFTYLTASTEKRGYLEKLSLKT